MRWWNAQRISTSQRNAIAPIDRTNGDFSIRSRVLTRFRRSAAVSEKRSRCRGLVAARRFGASYKREDGGDYRLSAVGCQDAAIRYERGAISYQQMLIADSRS